MATAPVPRTWGSGERITGVKLNEISTALNFVMDPPRCHFWNTVGLSFPDGTATRMNFTDVATDTDSMATSGTPTRVRFTTEGRYRITILLTMPPASYSTLTVNPRLNSGGSSSGGTSIRTWPFGQYTETIAITFEKDVDAADYIEIFITQTSGATRTSSGTSFGTAVQATWVSTLI